MTIDGLLERGRELDELDARIERAAAGHGCLVVVEGPAGIGKSRLIAETRGRAEGAMRVLSARGSELEREFPFGVVRQLFEAEVATRRSGRSCSPSMTSIGATAPRCSSSPICPTGSRASRSFCSQLCGRPSPVPTRRCSGRSRATPLRPASVRAR